MEREKLGKELGVCVCVGCRLVARVGEEGIVDLGEECEPENRLDKLVLFCFF